MGIGIFVAASIVAYAVLQLVALRVTSGILWRLSFGVAIPAAASVIVGVGGMAMGIEAAPTFFMLFAPLGAGVLALILGAHVMGRLRQDGKGR